MSFNFKAAVLSVVILEPKKIKSVTASTVFLNSWFVFNDREGKHTWSRPSRKPEHQDTSGTAAALGPGLLALMGVS